MANQVEFTDDSVESSNSLLNSLRRILMAGIGAVALTQEQIEDFVGKLVERGEIADGDAPHTPNGCPFQAWSVGEVLRLAEDVLHIDVGVPSAGSLLAPSLARAG